MLSGIISDHPLMFSERSSLSNLEKTSTALLIPPWTLVGCVGETKPRNVCQNIVINGFWKILILLLRLVLQVVANLEEAPGVPIYFLESYLLTIYRYYRFSLEKFRCHGWGLPSQFATTRTGPRVPSLTDFGGLATSFDPVRPTPLYPMLSEDLGYQHIPTTCVIYKTFNFPSDSYTRRAQMVSWGGV